MLSATMHAIHAVDFDEVPAGPGPAARSHYAKPIVYFTLQTLVTNPKYWVREFVYKIKLKTAFR
jgi:hypothetical protein